MSFIQSFPSPCHWCVLLYSSVVEPNFMLPTCNVSRSHAILQEAPTPPPRGGSQPKMERRARNIGHHPRRQPMSWWSRFYSRFFRLTAAKPSSSNYSATFLPASGEALKVRRNIFASHARMLFIMSALHSQLMLPFRAARNTWPRTRLHSVNTAPSLSGR